MIFADHQDPGMRFEALMNACFKCSGKYCDPFHYSSQDRYNNFVDEDDPEEFRKGQKALCTGLGILAFRHSDSEYFEELKRLLDSSWDARTQDEVISIIDKGIGIARKLGY